MKNWYGYTYPRVLQNNFCWWLWKKTFCKRGWHLWDEVLSERHYLFCDACEIELEIK